MNLLLYILSDVLKPPQNKKQPLFPYQTVEEPISQMFVNLVLWHKFI